MAKNISEESVKNYTEKLNKKGEDGFYRYLVAVGIKRSVEVANPEIEMMELGDAFLLLFRRTGDEIYDKFYKLFRRAAHCLYRQFNKNDNKDKKYNKFLRAV